MPANKTSSASRISEKMVHAVADALRVNGWNSGGDDQQFDDDVRNALQVNEVAQPTAQSWDIVTDASPEPLVDVMVCTRDPSNGECQVWMGWRSNTDPNRWLISGTDEPIRLPVYAWGPIMAPARAADFLRDVVDA